MCQVKKNPGTQHSRIRFDTVAADPLGAVSKNGILVADKVQNVAVFGQRNKGGRDNRGALKLTKWYIAAAIGLASA